MKNGLTLFCLTWALLLLASAFPRLASARGGEPIATAVSSAARPLTVPKLDAEIRIDGVGDDPAWSNAAALDHFKLYWNSETPQKTELRLFHNGRDLCFLYSVSDDDIIRETMIDEEMDIADEDRVEFGFSPEDVSLPYYFFEIDSIGRVLDYESRYYRYFDETWDSDGLEVFGRPGDGGYVVEGKFALDELRRLSVLNSDGTMRAGFFRGDYFTASDPEKNHVWISWIYSQTESPDFHIRSAFGKIRLAP